jgi:hypothetical protein
MSLTSRGFAVLAWARRELVFHQRRTVMASPFRAKKAIEELHNNPYYEKYSKKISAFQKFVVHFKFLFRCKCMSLVAVG